MVLAVYEVVDVAVTEEVTTGVVVTVVVFGVSRHVQMLPAIALAVERTRLKAADLESAVVLTVDVDLTEVLEEVFARLSSMSNALRYQRL